jgi:hypothetical protein
MNTDLQPLRPYLDDPARTVICQAAETLGSLRGYRGPYLDDPAVRLGLLASLQHQLRTDLVDTACQARELGYTSDELLTLLTIIQPPPRP